MRRVTLSSRRARAFLVASGTAAIVTAANASQGAYFSQSWGWVALAFLAPTTILALLERTTEPGRLRVTFLVATGALATWIALSSFWSMSHASSMREVERIVVYVALAFAVVFALRRGDTAGVAAGVLTGTSAIVAYAVGHWLYPAQFGPFGDETAPDLLSIPIGYANSFGLLSVLGLIVALGFVAQARGSVARTGGAALLPIFAVAIYLTDSRGAWLSLAVGATAMIALSPHRLHLVGSMIAVTPGLAVALALASGHEWRGETLSGHALTGGLFACSLVSIVLATGARYLSMRTRGRQGVSRAPRRVAVYSTLAVALAVVAVVIASGTTVGSHAERSLSGLLSTDTFSDSVGRSEQTRVALDSAREHLLVGNGAGTFEYTWYLYRTTPRTLRDAHNLYAESLSELGVVGLLLLLVALLVSVLAAVRARRLRFVPSCMGAFVAWGTGSAFDWHWEVVGVTITALLVGGACLVAADRRSLRSLTGSARAVVTGLGVVLSLFAVVSLVGNQALFAGRDAVTREDWSEARTHAERARALLPWSFEPDLVLGDAYAGLGDRKAALRAYRAAVATDERNWVAWLRLAQLASGREREHAYGRVHKLNPLEGPLPGENAAG